VYYAENFEIKCSVVNELDRDDASSIYILQNMFKDSNELKVLKTDLVYIHANFSFLLQCITKWEKTTNLLSETIKEINYFQDKLNKISGSNTDAVKQKSHSCFSKNKWFKVMWDFVCIRGGRPRWFWRPQRHECLWHHMLQVCKIGIVWCGMYIFSIQITLQL
jgi:hypothetical protein